MNFQKLNPVPTSQEILDVAFAKARQRGRKDLSGNWLQIIRRKESLKIDVISSSLTSFLEKIEQEFPLINELDVFYQKLFDLTIDVVSYKKALGSVSWTKLQIQRFQREYVGQIVSETAKEKINFLSTQYYGRISSILKRVDKKLQSLEKDRLIMRTFPDIKDLFTVCIYGFPNVGKTTLLNQLTGSKAKVAAYAFTTKSINAGYIEVEDKKIQLLDVPGTLNREAKKNNIELQADLVLEELASVIIYVFDLTEECGYSLESQEELFKEMKSKKNVLLYLSKIDLVSSQDLAKFSYPYFSFEALKKEIIRQASLVPADAL